MSYITMLLFIALFCYGSLILGRILASLTEVKSTNFFNDSFYIIVGFVLLVTIYALIVTKGYTIFILVFLGAFIIKFKKAEIDWRWVFRVNSAFLLLPLIFIWTSWGKLPASDLLYPGYFGDILFYGDVSDTMNYYGVENNLRHANLLMESILTPYHYFDLWLCALISKILAIPSVVAYSCAVQCVFLFALFLLFIEIFEKDVILAGICLVGLIVFGWKYVIPFDFIEESISPLVKYYKLYANPHLKSKTIPSLILIYYLIKLRGIEKGRRLSIFLLMLLLIISIENVFLAGTAFLIIFLLELYKSKKMIVKRADVVFLSTGALIGIIYVVSGMDSNLQFENQINFYEKIFQSLKAYFGILFFLILFFIIPLIIVIRNRVFNKDYQRIAFTVSIGILTLFLAQIVTIFQKDGYQFFTSTFWPLFFTILAAELVKIIFKDYISRFLPNIQRLLKPVVLLTLLFLSIDVLVKNVHAQQKLFSKSILSNEYLTDLKESLNSKEFNGFIAVFEEEPLNRISAQGFPHFYQFNEVGFYLPFVREDVKLLRFSDLRNSLHTKNPYSKGVFTNSFIVQWSLQEFKTIPESTTEQNRIIYEKISELNISVFIFSSEKEVANFGFENYLTMNNLRIEKEFKNPNFGEIVFIITDEI